MARALIVGCGCRGRMLGSALAESGWAVRGTSRASLRVGALSADGLESATADPDKPGSLVELVGDVSVLIYLMGSATGKPDELETIHDQRLGSLVEKLVDTPVRAFAYELSGSVPDRYLERGRAVLDDAAKRWHLRVGYIEADPTEPGAWLTAALTTVEDALG